MQVSANTFLTFVEKKVALNVVRSIHHPVMFVRNSIAVQNVQMVNSIETEAENGNNNEVGVIITKLVTLVWMVILIHLSPDPLENDTHPAY